MNLILSVLKFFNNIKEEILIMKIFIYRKNIFVPRKYIKDVNIELA